MHNILFWVALLMAALRHAFSWCVLPQASACFRLATSESIVEAGLHARLGLQHCMWGHTGYRSPWTPAKGPSLGPGAWGRGSPPMARQGPSVGAGRLARRSQERRGPGPGGQGVGAGRLARPVPILAKGTDHMQVHRGDSEAGQVMAVSPREVHGEADDAPTNISSCHPVVTFHQKRPVSLLVRLPIRTSRCAPPRLVAVGGREAGSTGSIHTGSWDYRGEIIAKLGIGIGDWIGDWGLGRRRGTCV